MRTIVIGDIHGCLDELRELVGAINPTNEDEVVSVGDLITKGPDPTGVLDFWMDRGWRAVLGNNEQRVLDVIDGGRERKEDVVRTANVLTRRAELLELVRSLPILLHRKDRGLAVVHGGVFPTTDLEDPGSWRRDDLLRMRFIRMVGTEWTRIAENERRETDPFWADVWGGPETVVYGHTPGYSIRRSDRAYGIDTGCVYGGELTAAILEGDAITFRSVPARRKWSI